MVAGRRLPRVSNNNQIVHGVIADSHDSTRGLGGAAVRLLVEDEVVAAVVTRQDGSFSVVLGSSRKRKRIEAVEIQVVKEQPCKVWNATRLVHLERDTATNTERTSDNGMIWRQDVFFHTHEAMDLCEVSTEANNSTATELHGHAERASIHLNEENLARLVGNLGLAVGLAWGLLLLWGMARWASRENPRLSDRQWMHEDDGEECGSNHRRHAVESVEDYEFNSYEDQFRPLDKLKRQDDDDASTLAESIESLRLDSRHRLQKDRPVLPVKSRPVPKRRVLIILDHDDSDEDT